MQEDFPLTPDPYRLVAEEIGISEQELLERLQQMKSRGVLRKMGAVLQHRTAGFHGNALCCWRIPAEEVERAASLLAAQDFVSHVYLRQPHVKWPYNVYTVFHGHTREECRHRVERTAAALGGAEHRMLFSRKNWKRSQLMLLQESIEERWP